MAYKKYNVSDNGKAVLDEPIDASTTSFVARNVENLPTSNFTLTAVQKDANLDIVKTCKIYITTRSGNAFSGVTVGYAGDSGKSFNDGDEIVLNIIAEHIIDLQNEVSRLETDKANLSGATFTGNSIFNTQLRLKGGIVFDGLGFINQNTDNIEIESISGKSISFNSGSNYTGFGTNNPSARIHTYGSGDSDTLIKIERSGIGVSKLGYNYVGSFSDTDFRLFRNGNVCATLKEDKSLFLTGNLTVDGSSLYSGISCRSSSGAQIFGIKRTNEVNNGDSEFNFYGGMRFKAHTGGSAVNAFRIRGDGITSFDSPIINVSPHIQPTLSNNWVNFGGGYGYLNYYKTPDGTVFIQGLVKDGDINKVLFVLPEGYRPPRALIFAAISHIYDDVARITIETNGNVNLTSGSTDWFSVTLNFNIYC